MAGKDHQSLQTIAHGVTARHQLGPRRRANRHSVKRFQPHAVACELVDIRGLDIAAAITQVRVAKVVGKDDDDVGFRVCGLRDGDRTEQAARDHCDCNQSHALHDGLTPLALSDIARSPFGDSIARLQRLPPQLHRGKEAGTSRLVFIYDGMECQDPESVDLAQIPERKSTYRDKSQRVEHVCLVPTADLVTFRHLKSDFVTRPRDPN